MLTDDMVPGTSGGELRKKVQSSPKWVENKIWVRLKTPGLR